MMFLGPEASANVGFVLGGFTQEPTIRLAATTAANLNPDASFSIFVSTNRMRRCYTSMSVEFRVHNQKAILTHSLPAAAGWRLERSFVERTSDLIGQPCGLHVEEHTRQVGTERHTRKFTVINDVLRELKELAVTGQPFEEV